MIELSNAMIKTSGNRCTCCNDTTIVTHDFNQNNRGVSAVTVVCVCVSKYPLQKLTRDKPMRDLLTSTVDTAVVFRDVGVCD